MAAEVVGLREFRRALARVDDDWPKELTKAHRAIANHMQSKARSNASQGGGAYARARTAIRGQGFGDRATIGVSNSGRIPFAQATFWGTKKRTGWYAANRYKDSPGEQFPEWVGNNWDAAKKNEGPYVINYTLAEELDEVMKQYQQTLDVISAAAFPD